VWGLRFRDSGFRAGAYCAHRRHVGIAGEGDQQGAHALLEWEVMRMVAYLIWVLRLKRFLGF